MNTNNNASLGDILVVDDNLANLKLLANILAEAGYQVRPAADGELALRSVQARRPALILLDIRMPGVDGFEVCRRLKADELTRDIPLIFLSGLADTADKSKGFSLGAADYITKPFDGEEVLARVRVHLALAAAREELRTRNIQLRQANAQLTGEIAEREQLTRQLELLSERLASAQEQERRKIAYELQEDVGQQLMALKFYLQMMEPGSGGKEAKTPQAEALLVVLHAMERIRKLLLDLTPPELEDFGLDVALPTYCERQAAAGGWNLHIDAPKPDRRAPRPVERACFRVLQEGLNNVLHHAQATEVWVQLRQDATELELVIRDNGSGFDLDAARDDERRGVGSLGLFGMQMRAKHVGGSLQIESAAGEGTEVRAVFPMSVAPVEPV